MAIELVITDLDGTIWGAEPTIHPATRDAMAELDRRGVDLIVATGRRARSCRDDLEANGLALPAVVLNGTHGVLPDPTTDPFHLHPFTPEGAVAVIESFAAAGLSPVAYTIGRSDFAECIVESATSTSPVHAAKLAPHAAADPLIEAALTPGVLVIGFAVLGIDELALRQVADAVTLGGFGEPTMTPDHMYGQFSLMVQPPGISKWNGVLAWCERQGIDPANTLAVGDGGNDAELISSAGIGLAIENGHPHALAAATATIPGPTTGGWAEVLRYLD